MLRIDPEPSECSSGCESGWTMYLEQSYGRPSSHTLLDSGFPCKKTVFYDEDDEDLSMVSDASSGPPQLQSHLSFRDEYYNDDDDSYNNLCFYSATSTALEKNSGKKRRIRPEEQDPSFLDDTASSPVLSFSKHNLNPTKSPRSMEVLDFSQGFSATHLKGKAALQEHLGFLQSVLPGNPTSSKPIRGRESRNKM